MDSGPPVDVIVVGAGPAAVCASWPLVLNGVRVLMVDGGRAKTLGVPTERPPLAELRNGHGADYLLGKDLAGLRDTGYASPKMRTAAEAGFEGGYAAQNRITTDGFNLIGAMAAGGLSRIWGAVCCCYDENDLAGTGIPFGQLQHSYRAVANRIGLSGVENGAMSRFLGAGLPLQGALPLTPLARQLLDAHDAGPPDPDFLMGRPHVAVLSEAKDGRNACSQDMACMWGCRQNAIYDAAQEIPKLATRPNFRYRPGLAVTRLQRAGDGWDVSGRDVDSGAAVALRAPRVVLAAGTIASTALVLRNILPGGTRVPVLSHPAFSAAYVMPRRVGCRLPERGYGNAQLCLRLSLSGEPGDYAFGLIYDAATMSASDLACHMPLTRRGALGLTRVFLPTLALALVYFPGRLSGSSAWIGADGNMVVKGGFDPAFGASYARVVRELGRRLRRYGAYMLPTSARLYAPGTEVHYGGTLAAGGYASPDGAIAGAPGLHVVDGAALPVLPAKSPTFSIMANADRIGTILAGILQRERQPFG